MAPDPQQLEDHFIRYIEDVGDILKSIGLRWGGEEQLDDDDQHELERKRFFVGYNFPEGDKRGEVFATFWYGQTGRILHERESEGFHKALLLKIRPIDYEVATIRIVFIPDHDAEDFSIDGEDTVHSVGELKDRLTMKWNHDVWKLNNEYLEENAKLYQVFARHEYFFKQNFKPIGATLTRLGQAWDGTEQKDNQPEDTKRTTGLFAIGGRGTKRYFVGYSRPRFALNDKGKASITKAAIWIDFWQGAKGIIQQNDTIRRVVLDDKVDARISVLFAPDEQKMTVEKVNGAQASDANEMTKLLGQIWKQNLFKLQ